MDFFLLIVGIERQIMISFSLKTTSVTDVPPLFHGFGVTQINNNGKPTKTYISKGCLEMRYTTCGVIEWHNMNGRMATPPFLILRLLYLNDGQYFLASYLLTKS